MLKQSKIKWHCKELKVEGNFGSTFFKGGRISINNKKVLSFFIN